MRRSGALALACLLAPAAAIAAPRPNFLFILSDDHAAHAIGAYGSRVNETPQIDRLARGGKLFRNCFAVNSICTPSRAAILTGKYSHQSGVTEFNRFDGSQPTLQRYLREAGYHTAIVGKWHLFSDPTDFDYWNVLPGQGLYHDPVMIENGVERKLAGYATDLITDIALERLRARPADRPFALFVHHKAPHRAWEPDAKHAALFKDRVFPEPETFHDTHQGRSRAAREATMTIERHLTKTDVKGDPPPGLTPAQEKSWHYQRYMQDYLACIASMDDNIGRLLEALQVAGLEAETVVVYASDQGFFLGDHGWYDKRFMYEESLRMPLIVRYPPLVAAGSEERRMVLNVDFAPTLLELAGLPVPADMQGRSFVPLLRGEAPPAWRTSMYYRYYHYPEHHRVQPHYGVRTERHKLIYFPRLDECELYDLEKDPREMRNAYADPAYSGVLADLRREMARLREELGDRDQYADGPPRSYLEPRGGPAELVLAVEEPIPAGPVSFDPTGRALAFGAWCRPDADDGVIVALGGASHGFTLYLEGGFPRALLRLDGEPVSVRGTKRLERGAWTHVAGVLRDSRLRLVIAGLEDCSIDAGALVARPADGLSIGADSGSLVAPYRGETSLRGELRDVRVYLGDPGMDRLRDWAGLPPYAGRLPVRGPEGAGAPRLVLAEPRVEVEEEVARTRPPQNGAGPLWCYGAPLVARRGNDVFASALETGEAIPPLSNTRPRLFQKRGDEAWTLLWQPADHRQREPCPVAVAGPSLLLSLNTSQSPPGTWYGPTRPELGRFAAAGREPAWLRPPYPGAASFTDHSYRGLGVDAPNARALLLHIDATTSEQHWAVLEPDGDWGARGVIAFPIRACYPQVAIAGNAAYVLAIGDIVEPVTEWQAYKREKTGSQWDYVFRRLFHAAARGLTPEGFAPPIEVENLDATAGYIRNQDLWIAGGGAAHLLYVRHTVQSALMRDRFFPGTPLRTALVHAVVEDGRVLRRDVLLEGGEGLSGPLPGEARFHESASGALHVVVALSEGGSRRNAIFRLLPTREPERPVPLREPFSAFFTASPRSGSAPSDVLDLFGVCGNGDVMRYARVRLR